MVKRYTQQSIIDKRNYFAPLTTRKPKHETMKDNDDINILRNRNDKCIGAIDFAKMIPVPDSHSRKS